MDLNDLFTTLLRLDLLTLPPPVRATKQAKNLLRTKNSLIMNPRHLYLPTKVNVLLWPSAATSIHYFARKYSVFKLITRLTLAS